MSGASRACNSASGSIDLAAACSLACARMDFKAVSSCLKTGTEWEYMGWVMGCFCGELEMGRSERHGPAGFYQKAITVCHPGHGMAP